jgi:hypothetical protein
MTTNHISDDLPRLLTGEAPRDVVLDAAAHLRTCADCQQELVSAVVAHASLASAQRFAPEVVAPDRRPAAEPAESRALPDLEAVFRQVREEAAATSATPRRRRVLFAAAAAAAVVGGGTAIAIVETGSSDTPAGRTVALQSVGNIPGRATVTLVGDTRMRIDATALPALDETHRYEVWLTRPHAGLQPIGFIGNDRTGDFTLPTSLMAQYDEIAISNQRSDQVAYSGITVAQGSLD